MTRIEWAHSKADLSFGFMKHQDVWLADPILKQKNHHDSNNYYAKSNT
jgi:hypothetical protein